VSAGSLRLSAAAARVAESLDHAVEKATHGLRIDAHQNGVIEAVPQCLLKLAMILSQQAKLLAAIQRRPVWPRPLVRLRDDDCARQGRRTSHGDEPAAAAGFCPDFGREETRSVTLKMNLPSRSSRLTEPWVMVTWPPGGIICSLPPGTSER
jgi:hypothetical protein